MSTVLIAPTQGEHASLFLSTARDILKNIYKSKGSVFKTVIDEDRKVEFKSDGLARSFWDSVSAADTFITVSHCGLEDGPNLAFHDRSFPLPGSAQPWPTDGNTSHLSLEGMLFWSRVGMPGRSNTAKIILIGCDTGKTYAGAVNKVAHCPVFGFKDLCAAANSGSMQQHIKNIELAGASPGMKRFG